MTKVGWQLRWEWECEWKVITTITIAVLGCILDITIIIRHIAAIVVLVHTLSRFTLLVCMCLHIGGVDFDLSFLDRLLQHVNMLLDEL